MSYHELPPTPADFEQVYGQVVLLARLPGGRIVAQHGRARVDVGSSADFRDEAVETFRVSLTTKHVSYVQWFDGWRMRWWDGPLPDPDAAPPALIARDGRPADVVMNAGLAPEPLHEWACPGCGATTRARMADVVPPPPPEARLRAATRSLLDLLDECDIDMAFNRPTVEALRRKIRAVATALAGG